MPDKGIGRIKIGYLHHRRGEAFEKRGEAFEQRGDSPQQSRDILTAKCGQCSRRNGFLRMMIGHWTDFDFQKTTKTISEPFALNPV